MSLTNHVQKCIARYQSNIGYCRLGIVAEVNPANSTIQAILEPQVTPTNDIPYSTPWIGWYAPPTPGDQVLVLFQEGSKNVPIGALLLYWNNAVPPANIESGEAILQHSSGSSIKLVNDGTVHIKASSIVLDDGSTLGEALAKFAELKSYIDNHIHSGVQTGGGNSGVPTVPLPANVGTTIVKGA